MCSHETRKIRIDSPGKRPNASPDADSPRTIPDRTTAVEASRLQKHWWSTIGLCGSAFSMFYLIMNAFPYSGFMALHLLNGSQQEQQQGDLLYTAATIGPYAGILVSSFRLGRIPTAIPWGHCADTYGRKFALLVGLVAMVVGNLLFGLAPTYSTAVFVRFLTGILNGTMVVVRTSISEIAKGDCQLESKGVAMMSSMSGYGMLVGPAIGGLLSEPLKQYPKVFSRIPCIRKVLETFPFLLPNLVGSLVALTSLVIVVVCVEETLPEDQTRDWRFFPTDVLRWIQQKTLRRTGEGSAKPMVTESTPLIPSTSASTGKIHDPEEQSASEDSSPPTGIYESFFHTTSRVRYFFYSMWSYAFTSLASSEAFPLFAMASTNYGGLGLDEKRIGIVQTIAGTIFVLGQYHVFTFVKKRFGLMESLRIGALYSNLLLMLIPLGIYFSPSTNSDTNNWYQLGYLGLVSGLVGIFGSIYMGCATIGVNGCIKQASQRASMNGLQSMVASFGRGFGPIVSGFLVASAMTSGAIPSQVSGWAVYIVLVAMGMVTYAFAKIIPEEER